MTEVIVGGSAVLDIATKDDLGAHQARIEALLQRPHARFQIYHGAVVPRAGNAPTQLRLDTPRPAGGWMWLLQWCWLSGDDPSISAAIANARAILVKGARLPDAALTLTGTTWGNLDYPGILIPGLVIPTPNAVTIPDKMVVYDHEELYFVLAGAGLVAGAANYHGSVGVIELPQTPEALTW